MLGFWKIRNSTWLVRTHARINTHTHAHTRVRVRVLNLFHSFSLSLPSPIFLSLCPSLSLSLTLSRSRSHTHSPGQVWRWSTKPPWKAPHLKQTTSICPFKHIMTHLSVPWLMTHSYVTRLVTHSCVTDAWLIHIWHNSWLIYTWHDLWLNRTMAVIHHISRLTSRTSTLSIMIHINSVYYECTSTLSIMNCELAQGTVVSCIIRTAHFFLAQLLTSRCIYMYM